MASSRKNTGATTARRDDRRFQWTTAPLKKRGRTMRSRKAEAGSSKSRKAFGAGMLIAVMLTFAPWTAESRNAPCSGKKGGISHCEGQVFVCNDGSSSASKRSCPAYTGAATPPARTAPQALRSSSSCSCSSGTYCTGPRGGRFCETSTGSKRYQRK